MNPGTGEVLWKHVEDEGPRGQNAARGGAGRGVAYWSSANGSDQRIIYVTPGYRMIALDAKTGAPIPTFGQNGVVDLKLDDDQEMDLVTADIGLNATPLVAGDVVVVGAAHRFSGSPRSKTNVRGYVRGFDVKTGKRLWIFHTVPKPGEFGYDTWLNESADYTGNTGAWAQFSADLDLGLVYVGVEMPTGDFYGGNRPGQHALRREHRGARHQDRQAQVALPDDASRPLGLRPAVRAGALRRHDQRPPHPALAQPTKQAFLFVLNRETGEPIWPIEERAVPQSTVPNERTSPTQPFPTKPAPFDRQGVSIDDLIDFTPALRAEAVEAVKRYKIGPLFTPPTLSNPDGPIATLMLPADTGGANWPGASFDPETNHLFIHSHTAVYVAGIVPAPATSDFGYVGGTARARRPRRRGAVPSPPPIPMRRRRGRAARRRARRGRRAQARAGRAPHPAAGRGGTTVQGLPLIKPPYDRITAYDMKTGEMLWQKAHSSTPDDIKNNPALQGLNLPRLGQPGRTFIGTLTTKTLLIAGEGGVHRNDAGAARRAAARLRQVDGRRSRRGRDAGQADRLADDLHVQRQAVHRRRRQRRGRRAVDRVRAAIARRCDDDSVADSSWPLCCSPARRSARRGPRACPKARASTSTSPTARGATKAPTRMRRRGRRC